MKNKKQYCSYRIQLEKLKHRTWYLIIVARFMLFLAIIVRYLGRS